VKDAFGTEPHYNYLDDRVASSPEAVWNMACKRHALEARTHGAALKGYAEALSLLRLRLEPAVPCTPLFPSDVYASYHTGLPELEMRAVVLPGWNWVRASSVYRAALRAGVTAEDFAVDRVLSEQQLCEKYGSSIGLLLSRLYTQPDSDPILYSLLEEGEAPVRRVPRLLDAQFVGVAYGSTNADHPVYTLRDWRYVDTSMDGPTAEWHADQQAIKVFGARLPPSIYTGTPPDFQW
jgi:hypothetical protein